MLHKIKDLIGNDVVAEGNKIGVVTDFLFDDKKWTIRYVVVDTGDWLSSRKVLISPYSIKKHNFADQVFPVSLTKKQIEESPPISANEPVSRQHEISLNEYYGWRPYFVSGRDPVGEPAMPVDEMKKNEPKIDVKNDQDDPDPHLRSCKHVTGYNIQATDNEIGHLEDFFVDDDNWIIRYFVIDTRNWLPGKKVVLAISWIENVSWQESKVFVPVTRETIKKSPEYIPSAPLTRAYEEKLHLYYKRPIYWG